MFGTTLVERHSISTTDWKYVISGKEQWQQTSVFYDYFLLYAARTNLTFDVKMIKKVFFVIFWSLSRTIVICSQKTAFEITVAVFMFIFIAALYLTEGSNSKTFQNCMMIIWSNQRYQLLGTIKVSITVHVTNPGRLLSAWCPPTHPPLTHTRFKKKRKQNKNRRNALNIEHVSWIIFLFSDKQSDNFNLSFITFDCRLPNGPVTRWDLLKTFYSESNYIIKYEYSFSLKTVSGLI